MGMYSYLKRKGRRLLASHELVSAPSNANASGNESNGSRRTRNNGISIAVNYNLMTAQSATGQANGRGHRQADGHAAARPDPVRRLPRGWWPDGVSEDERKKRAGLRFNAMDDLKEETFVVNEDHLEWVFPEDTPGDDAAADPLTTEPQCYLILPAQTKCSSPLKPHSSQRTSSECAICMLDYDVGDVVLYSKHCSHAFHQDCILDWFSRDNAKCPTCRADFWSAAQAPHKNTSSAAAATPNGPTQGDADADGSRARTDTEDTELSADDTRPVDSNLNANSNDQVMA